MVDWRTASTLLAQRSYGSTVKERVLSNRNKILYRVIWKFWMVYLHIWFFIHFAELIPVWNPFCVIPLLESQLGNRSYLEYLSLQILMQNTIYLCKIALLIYFPINIPYMFGTTSIKNRAKEKKCLWFTKCIHSDGRSC